MISIKRIAALQIITIVIPLAQAFTTITTNVHVPHSNSFTLRHSEKNGGTKLQMVGDFFSGITGQAPKSLDVSFDELLSGTNIDPARDNVDLTCVYKASRDGWSAIDFHNCSDDRGMFYVLRSCFNLRIISTKIRI